MALTRLFNKFGMTLAYVSHNDGHDAIYILAVGARLESTISKLANIDGSCLSRVTKLQLGRVLIEGRSFIDTQLNKLISALKSNSAHEEFV